MGSSSGARDGTDSLASEPQSQLQRGVRVVGKIRPFVDSEAGGSSCRARVSVTRFVGDHALVAFDDQQTCRKDSYKLDWCYEQDENIDQIFTAEVKPLIEGLFRGHNGCVIAYGAPGSGKSQLIQGSGQNPGLVMIALGEILAFANENRGSVTVSCYEVSQDHIYDLLEPKDQEVLILEDAAKRIQLKGLSQIPVNSISDFKKLSFHGCNMGKSWLKLPDDRTVRSHRGLIVYLSSVDKESNSSLIGKINFVCLADYEDIKQKGNPRPQLAESTKINKSLYTLLNIVCALNAGENFIPFRESKLTRLLQDFLCKASRAVLITCLNPTICQDTLSAVNLASRSCQVANRHRCHSAKVTKSGSKFNQSCSPSIVGIPVRAVSQKKNEISQCASAEKKGYGTPYAIRRRSLQLGSLGTCFSEKQKTGFPSAIRKKKMPIGSSPPNKSESRKANSRVDIVAAVDTCSQALQGNIVLDYVDVDCPMLEEESCESVGPNCVENIMPTGGDCYTNEDTFVQDTVVGLGCDEKMTADPIDGTKDEIHKIFVNEDQSSPPLSARLREISNSLKLLSTQTTAIGSPNTDMTSTKQINKEKLDPKTPEVPFAVRLENEPNFDYIGSPQDIFKTRSTGLKKYLAQECLTFLNSANKEELKGLKGIGEKRATYILQLREESSEPFKNMDDLKEIGLSRKQINAMMSQVLGDF
uniref:Kinesin motor domain-containing protein n=1 Tax=Musa acuminata subsp. malaccensis TaxID=214687 RepID=A0A804INP0_MUSAM|nr:PREDICTED: kinesin-like protein KIN-10C isoform X1 [Musa acuminata subsp. malaccensis]